MRSCRALGEVLLPATRQFPIQRFPGDAQLGGHVLPAAPVGQGSERGQKARLLQACDDAFLGSSIAVIPRRIGGGFREDGVGPCVLQKYLRAMRGMAQQMNAAGAHQVDARDFLSLHVPRLTGGEPGLASILKQHRTRHAHDRDHLAGSEGLQQRGNTLPEAFCSDLHFSPFFLHRPISRWRRLPPLSTAACTIRPVCLTRAMGLARTHVMAISWSEGSRPSRRYRRSSCS